MSQSMMLCNWTTVQGDGNTVIQNEADWLDTSGYQDACFYLQIGGINTGAGTTVLDLQCAPTKDDVFFTAKAGSTPAIARFSLTSSTTLGVQTLVISRWATEANQPLSKYLRWSIAFPASQQTTVTFRIWVTLNQAGY
ncbi:MAG TPA: hypothetical protein VHK47_11445 [Polyangia bacterium]|nr:hypothetical protein [Polyangia bacterium]